MVTGKKILITSGPTRGPIDRVRYITNKSTGRLGSLIASQALARGAIVTFVFGKGSLTPKRDGNLTCVEIETVADVKRVLEKELGRSRYDAVIHLMAVLDYIPDSAARTKIASGKDELVVRLMPTPKLIRLVKELSPASLLVGFKLEVEARRDNLLTAARRLLEQNNCDIVVANDLAPIEAGRDHLAYLVDKQGASAPIVGKAQIADRLIQTIGEMLA